jgi:hypothetical protein
VEATTQEEWKGRASPPGDGRSGRRHGENKRLGLWRPGLSDCQMTWGFGPGRKPTGRFGPGKRGGSLGIMGSQRGPKCCKAC